MCDKDTQADVEEYFRRHPELTRRDFAKLTAAVGLSAILPQVANAQSVTETDVNITTPDGVAKSAFWYRLEV